MSRRGNCWDNAPQESFFGHFKDEANFKNCETLDDVKKEINEYMNYYNNYRYQWNLIIKILYLLHNIPNLHLAANLFFQLVYRHLYLLFMLLFIYSNYQIFYRSISLIRYRFKPNFSVSNHYTLIVNEGIFYFLIYHRFFYFASNN